MNKLKSLKFLENFSKKEKANGKKIVLCHGDFDMLHFGHINHFKKAKQLGDYLIISVTSDKFIQKGINRPLYKQDQRVEFLTLLSIVDFVYLDFNRTATNVISKIRPNYYVKGTDYKVSQKKIIGVLLEEKKAVERYNGKLFFTNEESFSSSNIINNQTIDKNLISALKKIKNNYSFEKINNIIESISKLKVLIIGDTIIDEYDYVSPLGKPSKENIIATLYENKELFAGGIFASINTISSFCDNVDFITTIGSPKIESNFIRQNIPKNIKKRLIYKNKFFTTKKTRFVEKDHYKIRKLFEVYNMIDKPVDKSIEKKISNYLNKNLKKYDLVIVHDYGHGLITKKMIDILESKSKFLCVNAQINAGNKGYNLITKYNGASYYCLDIAEARMAVQDKYISNEKMLDLLFKKTGGKNITVTMGAKGSLSRKRNNTSYHMPAFSNIAIDTIGAGDAYYILSSLVLYLSKSTELAALAGNIAGSIKIGIPGLSKKIQKTNFVNTIKTFLKTK